MYDYAFLEDQLNAIILSLDERLSRDKIKDVNEFIKVGEYGLAYETLCSIVVESERSIPPDIHLQLVRLGQKMEMTEDVWLKLKPHVEQE
jgi:hypothetical protein